MKLEIIQMLFLKSYVTFIGIGVNDEAVSYAFAGDHVAVNITGIDMAHVGVGKFTDISVYFH